MKSNKINLLEFEMEVVNKPIGKTNLNIFRKFLKENKHSIYRFQNENELKEFFLPKRKYDPIDEIELMASEPMSKYNRKAFSKYLKNKK